MAATKDTRMNAGEMEVASDAGAGAGAGALDGEAAMDGATMADASMTVITTMATQLNLASILISLVDESIRFCSLEYENEKWPLERVRG